MRAEKIGTWGGAREYESYGFKTKSAAKRFMKSLGFTGRKVEGRGEPCESHGYQRGKLTFGRFFLATHKKDYKYVAHIRRK